ncbi:DUF2268 domain-containing putative Zn-dependent protease [Planococcus sp. N028]|uniref:DUF2268 domain-containing putative Zn-dependent protease n=1 Tax=Planococcus shixiaomingii TaxID=3058393 RepID=A0ABT8MYC7_9BACL|nr:DUF2268 domain-containing putative Zn-dependent protease [Planococcus sp. N028]MDN7240644.1 DUF2268 domain-containing putative Zn-dependent protease [Planococcus sp. N028]
MEISKQDKSVKVVPRLTHMEIFLEAIALHPESSRKDLFLKIFNLSEKELETISFFGIFNLESEIGRLETQLNKLRNLSYEDFIKDELTLLQKEYPVLKAVEFELFILDEQDHFVRDKLGGVSAFTDWSGKMFFAVFPDAQVRSTLRSVINHEYHHHWRTHALNITEQNQTLMDRLILEGLAEHFVKIRLGDAYLGPYKDALTEEQAKDLWERTYKLCRNELGERTDFYMFGSKDENLPLWAGYSLGYYLVKWYVEKNEGSSFEYLTSLDSEKFSV